MDFDDSLEITKTEHKNWPSIQLGTSVDGIDVLQMPSADECAWAVLLDVMDRSSVVDRRIEKVAGSIHVQKKPYAEFVIVPHSALAELLADDPYQVYVVGCHRKPTEEELFSLGIDRHKHCLTYDSELVVPLLESCGGEYAFLLYDGCDATILHRDAKTLVRFVGTILSKQVKCALELDYEFSDRQVQKILDRIRTKANVTVAADPTAENGFHLTLWEVTYKSPLESAADVRLVGADAEISTWEPRELPKSQVSKPGRAARILGIAFILFLCIGAICKILGFID